MRPKKPLSDFRLVGKLQFLIDFTLEGSVATPSSDMIWPKYSTCFSLHIVDYFSKHLRQLVNVLNVLPNSYCKSEYHQKAQA